MVVCWRQGGVSACKRLSSHQLLVFFLFFLLAVIFGETFKSFFTIFSSFVTKGRCYQYRTYFIGLTKRIWQKIPCVKQQAISVTLFTATNIHSMQKSTTNNQKLGNKMTEISRVKRERESEMISEKFRGKRKGKVFKEEIGWCTMWK